MAEDTTEGGSFASAFRARELPHIPGYRVREILGSGGHSTVFLADDPHGSPVAIKRWRSLAATPAGSERIEREVAALRELRHPHIVRAREWLDETQGGPALVMDAVLGPSLAEEIVAQGTLAPARLLEIAEPLLGALMHLGERGLVHRDLKPTNVVLRPSDGLPVLVDFSIVKRRAAADPETRTGVSLGTSAYMAPEQCARELGDVDERTDVYGFGALAFHAVCGLPPWTHESGWERAQRNPWRTPYPAEPRERARVEAARARVPRRLAKIIERCLEGDPRRRFPNAAVLAAALQPAPRGPRRPLLLGIAALSLCSLVGWSFFDHSGGLAPNEGGARTAMPPSARAPSAVIPIASASRTGARTASRRTRRAALAHWTGDGHADDALADHHGLLVGQVGFAPGRVGRAFSFDGSSWVEVPDDPRLDFTGEFTVTAWVRPAATSGRIVDKVVPHTGTGWLLDIYEGHLRGLAGEGPPVVGEGSLRLASWQHVGVVFDGTEVRLYLDGSLDASGTTYRSHTPASGTSLRLGANASFQERFDGLIDEVYLFDVALDQRAVAALRDGGARALAAGAADSDLPALPAPAGLEIRDVTSTSVSLSWNPVAGATDYRLERGVPGEPVRSLGVFPAPATPFVDVSVAAGETYAYRVIALEAGGGTSPASPGVWVTVP